MTMELFYSVEGNVFAVTPPLTVNHNSEDTYGVLRIEQTENEDLSADLIEWAYAHEDEYAVESEQLLKNGQPVTINGSHTFTDEYLPPDWDSFRAQVIPTSGFLKVTGAHAGMASVLTLVMWERPEAYQEIKTLWNSLRGLVTLDQAEVDEVKGILEKNNIPYQIDNDGYMT